MNAKNHSTPKSLILACAALLVASQAVAADKVVVPSSLKTVEGDVNNSFPFNLGSSSIRYQQVYAASEFPYNQPIKITHVWFRPDAAFKGFPGLGSAFSSTLLDVQINLSTTTKAPDALSTTFSANVGSDDTVVFSGALSLSSAFTGPDLGPKDFDIEIALTTPFTYDPAAGNLLLDVRNIGGGQTTVFDAVGTLGDTTSRVFGRLSSPTGTTFLTGTYGLVTQFTVIPAVTMVPLDIKPETCPNPVNLNASGVLPAAIAGTPTLDVTQIDPASIRLVGVAPNRYSLEDETTVYEPLSGKDEASDCTTQGRDGTVDLLLKFDIPQLAAAVRAELKRDCVDGEVLVLTLTGKMLESAGGASIQGEDVVVVVKAGKK